MPSSEDINLSPLNMAKDSSAFKNKRSDSFDNSVSTIEVPDSMNTTSANLDVPSMEKISKFQSPSKSKRSRNDVTLDESFKHGHETKRNGNSNVNVSAQNNSNAHESFPKRKKKSILEAYPMHQNASDASRSIITQLKSLYKSRVRPIEEKFGLYNFCLPTNAELYDSEFDAKPMVLLVGQYSTGKTTFIRHLVGGDYPSMHIGPEPTTDRFTALIHGDPDEPRMEDDNSDVDDDTTFRTDDDMSFLGNTSVRTNPKNVLTKRWKKDGINRSNGKTLKGNSLTVMPELPFASLSAFGSGFLSHFVGSITPSPLLEHVTLIDTPGVLSGEKQRLSRSYDFAKASRWFADRSDLILLLFDAHKLDISDELKDVIETIRPHNDDKIRCVLNKADGVTREQLVRVYGSLMWSMGKIFNSPEVVRVYTGSYWDEPLVHDDFENMFESDEWLLIHELVNLPKSCAERKVNEVVKRIRIIKVHVCILSFLKSRMPRWFGKKKAQDELIENLEQIFDVVRIENNLSAGDFPDLNEFAACLEEVEDFSSFMTADQKTLRLLDDLIMIHIPNIMKGTSGITDPFSPKTKRTPSKRKTRTPRKEQKDLIGIKDDSALDEENEQPQQGVMMKKPALDQDSAAFSFFGLFVFSILLAYVAVFIFVQQDVTNALSLPDPILKHFAQVAELLNMAKQFVEDHVYDSNVATLEF